MASFPTRLPLYWRPYHGYEHATNIDDLGVILTGGTVTADMRTDIDDFVLAIQDPANWDDPLDARAIKCAKCSGAGQHAESVDTGDVLDTDLIHCGPCDGFGWVKDAVIPERIIWPVSATAGP